MSGTPGDRAAAVRRSAGLFELEEQTLSFDKPQGRIIEVYAALNGPRYDQVQEYYSAILPQFGWGKSADNAFYRAGEVMEISLITDQEHPLVKFLIRPSL